MAELINHEQMQQVNNKYSKQNVDNTKINYLSYEYDRFCSCL